MINSRTSIYKIGSVPEHFEESSESNNAESTIFNNMDQFYEYCLDNPSVKFSHRRSNLYDVRSEKVHTKREITT